MNNCTKERCPLQGVVECSLEECPYKTEPQKEGNRMNNKDLIMELVNNLEVGAKNAEIIAKILDCDIDGKVADVVEIVRCNDCDYWDSKEKVCNHCWGGLENCSENEFCSRGERKETDE